MKNTFFLGTYLAKRAVKRTSFLSKIFIIFIMMLTFLNVLLLRGVLVGVPNSSLENIRNNETGDVIISRLDSEIDIGKTYEMTKLLDQSSYVKAYSIRYQATAMIESDYQKSKKDGVNSSRRSVQVMGIDPVAEESVTRISRFIIDGRMIKPGETGSIVIGKGILEGEDINFTGEDLLQNVKVGGRVLLTVGNFVKEYRVVGIMNSKGKLDLKAVILDTEIRSILGRTNMDASDIAIRLFDEKNDTALINNLKVASFGDEAKFETSAQAAGEFIDDIKTIFDFLSSFVALVGVFIASITIFIIIFVNIVARKQEIGIARAIGVPQSVIIFSYFLQSCFYAIAGVSSALFVFFVFFVPFFRRNPIDFPFTDVYLAVDFNVIAFQASILFIAAGIAGYIPAKMIIKQDVLSLILGR